MWKHITQALDMTLKQYGLVAQSLCRTLKCCRGFAHMSWTCVSALHVVCSSIGWELKCPKAVVKFSRTCWIIFNECLTLSVGEDTQVVDTQSMRGLPERG